MSTLEPATHSATISAGLVASRPSARIRWWRLAPLLDGTVLMLAVVLERLGGRAVGDTLPLAWLLLFPPVALSLLGAAGFYRPRLRVQLLDDLRTIAGATAIAAMTTITLSVLIEGHGSIGAQGVRLWLFATVYLAASRGGVISALVAARRDGEVGSPTLIIGAGSVGRLLAKRLTANPEIGLRPVGFVDKDPLVVESAPDSQTLPVLGASWDLPELIEQYDVEHVLVTFSRAPHEVMLRIVDECTRRNVRVTLVPRLFERMPRQLTIDYLGGIPLISIHPSSPQSWSYRTKYVLDRAAAALAILVVSPVLLAIALGVLLSTGRPVLFRQARIGCDGRVFQMLKFRSMRGGMPTDFAPPVGDLAPGGVEGDDRRTTFGSFIRRTSLDELPQLLNVLRGEMSLVGPRPERPEFVDLFTPRVKRYSDRHRVKSGITGWAQINGLRGKTSLSDRVEWDNWYIENWSLWLDLKILLATARAVLRPPVVE